jgi:hypothetical protein
MTPSVQKARCQPGVIMKQALVSLIRVVVRARSESITAKVVLSELSLSELQQVAGGALSVDLPKNGW